MKKIRVHSLALAALLIAAAGVSAQTVWDGTTTDTSWFTDNKSADTFTITTARQLAGLGRLLSIASGNGSYSFSGKTIKLGANIALNDTTNWQNWANSAPTRVWQMTIGSYNDQTRNYPFLGTFDGAGFVVSGVYLSGGGYKGLFGYVGQGATIKNLGVVASYIIGSYYVGGLVGNNSGGTIINCYTAGSVNGTRNSTTFAGGLVGYNAGGTITNCYSTANVTGIASSVGGLVGSGGTITNSYATGNVTGSGGGIGGLVGSGGTITNCYATGNVTGSGSVGGLGGSGGTITNSYATGDVTGSGSYVGGLAGNGTIINGYYDRETSGQSDEGKGTPKHTAEMQSREFAELLNAGAFASSVNEWVYSQGNYPTLSSEVTAMTEAEFFESGNGAESDPYIIKTKGRLENLSALVNGGVNFRGKYVKLSNNIALNDTAGWRNWANNAPANHWVAIGRYANDNDNVKFRGTFDGAGFVVAGVYINSSSGYQGLFGYVGEGGIIKNLGVVASYVKGSSRVGVLAGVIDGYVYWTGAGGDTARIVNCYAAGNVSGSGGSVGGLVGINHEGAITNSYASVNVTGTGNNSYIGGLVGWNYEASITNSYATGDVTGTETGDDSNVGGLVGYNSGASITNSYAANNVSGSRYVGGLAGYTSGTVTNSYAIGDVTGSYYVGGLVGYNYGAAITNSYAIGDITGTGYYVGGLVGYSTSAAITNSYAIGDVTGGYYVGGLVGDINRSDSITGSYYNSETAVTGSYPNSYGTPKTSAQLKQQSTYIDWDFDNVWTIAQALNAGYPHLRESSTSVFEGKFARPSSTVSVPQLSVRGRTLFVSTSNSSGAQIRLLDLRGRTIASFKMTNSGAHRFSLAKIPSGRYIAEMRTSGKRVKSEAVVLR